MRFIDYADANRIVLAVLPPHSTHRLQPLDVGLFSPLATYYSQQIDRLLVESQGLVRLTKRDFWLLFYEAWRQAFTMKNIQSAWEKRVFIHIIPEKYFLLLKFLKKQYHSLRKSSKLQAQHEEYVVHSNSYKKKVMLMKMRRSC
jgi:hypothetical protein